VISINALVLSLLLAQSQPLPIIKPLERAFLENSPRILSELLTAEGDIQISLPDPLSVADELSSDQVYLVFKRIFAVYKTTEFFVDPDFSTLQGRPGGILRARWSFLNQKTGDQYPIRLFIYLTPDRAPEGSASGGPGTALRIVEIRAEKL